jgi:hypothetical protein
MKAKITPFGIVLKIVYEGKTYMGLLQNDFVTYKTFGNGDLSIDTLILFDEDFNKLSFEPFQNEQTSELYSLFEEQIEKIVIDEEDDDDEDDIDPAGGHGIHSHV